MLVSVLVSVCVCLIAPQCHHGTGYCWCVTPDGKPIPGSSIRHTKPNCNRQSENTIAIATYLSLSLSLSLFLSLPRGMFIQGSLSSCVPCPLLLSLSLSLSLTEKMEQFTERDDDDDVLFFFLQKKALSTPDEAYFLPSFSVFFRYLFFF